MLDAPDCTHAQRPEAPRFDDEALAIVTLRPGAPQTPTARALAWSLLMLERADRRADPAPVSEA